MSLTLTGLKILAFAVSSIVAMLIALPLIKCTLSYQAKNKNISKSQPKWSIIVVFLFGIFCINIFNPNLLVVICGSLFIFIGYLIVSKIIKCEFKYKVMYLYWAWVLPLFMVLLLKNTLTEVTAIDGNRYPYSNNRYELFSPDFPGFNSCYVDNRSNDTLYRIIISYAIPGKDSYNVYNITDTVPAHSVKKVNGPISYCLYNIPVTLSPSISRFGQKSRRKLSFLVRKGQMLKFIYSDCEKVGLLQNKRETNIRENILIQLSDPVPQLTH